jgi:hypothetical protein
MKTKKYDGENGSLVDEDTRRSVLERIQAMQTAGGGEGASLPAGPAMESSPMPKRISAPVTPRVAKPKSELDKKAEMAAYLRNAEQTASSETSPLAKAKIKEASDSARRAYEMAQRDESMKAYKPRYTPSAAAPKTTQGATYRNKPYMPDEVNTGYKKGGSVSSASKRADGIAQKGKTRGKMC